MRELAHHYILIACEGLSDPRTVGASYQRALDLLDEAARILRLLGDI